MRRIFTDYDSDFAPAFQVFDSEQFLDSDAKQGAAHSLAFVLFHLKQLIKRNNIESVLALLDEGLNEIFPYTDIFHLNKKLFMEYLTGDLKPDKEPLYVLNRALGHEKD